MGTDWLAIVMDTLKIQSVSSVTECRISKFKSHTDNILGTPDYVAVYARFFWAGRPAWSVYRQHKRCEYCSLQQLISA